LAINKNTYLNHCSRLLPLLITLFLSGGAWAVDFKGVELGQHLRLGAERSAFGRLDCNPMQLDPVAYQGYLQEMQQVMPGARKVCTSVTAMTEKWGEGVEEVREEHDKSVWWDFDDGISVSVHLTPYADDASNSTDDILLVGLAEYSLPVTTPAGDL